MSLVCGQVIMQRLSIPANRRARSLTVGLAAVLSGGLRQPGILVGCEVDLRALQARPKG
jgi:hypothetical protein